MNDQGYRYSRQTRLREVGAAGAARLAAAHALIVGVGALGSQLAELLCRAGIRKLTLIDPDVVDLSNLQRQSLYCERDAQLRLPKVAAAKARLQQINSQLEVAVHATEFGSDFLIRHGLPDDVDVLLDGLDQLEARLLLNEAAVAASVPYVYGAALGMEGCCLPILPGRSACLYCLLQSPAAHLSQATCASAGILASTISQVAAAQFTEAVKILVGQPQACRQEMLYFNLWENLYLSMPVARLPDCPVCVQRLAQGSGASAARTLCGRNAIQVVVPNVPADYLTRMAAGFADAIRGQSAYHLEVSQQRGGQPYRMTFFSDGRVIVDGTRDAQLARDLLPAGWETA